MDEKLAEKLAKGEPLSSEMQLELARVVQLAAASGIKIPDGIEIPPEVVNHELGGKVEKPPKSKPLATIISGSQEISELLHAAATGDTKSIMQILSQHPQTIDKTDNAGYTATMHAAAAGHTGAVRLLVDSKADLALRSNNECIALHFAAKHGGKEMCSVLADGCPAMIDAFSIESDTPLLWACLEDRYEAIVSLLDRGARADAVNRYGSSPCHCLVTWSETVAQQAEAEGTPDPTKHTSLKRDPAKCQVLGRLIQANRVQLNWQDCAGCTPLHIAAGTSACHNQLHLLPKNRPG